MDSREVCKYSYNEIASGSILSLLIADQNTNLVRLESRAILVL